MSYTFEVKTTKENLEVEILDMKGKSWRIASKEYTTVTFSYADNRFTITSSNGNELALNTVLSSLLNPSAMPFG
jgi:hypothetical protein